MLIARIEWDEIALSVVSGSAKSGDGRLVDVSMCGKVSGAGSSCGYLTHTQNSVQLMLLEHGNGGVQFRDLEYFFHVFLNF